MKKRTGGISIYLLQFLFAFVPLVIGAFVLSYIAITEINESLVDGVYNTLEVACKGAKEYFEFDTKSTGVID